MKLRTKNNTTIQYILVSNGSPIISTIIPPEDFQNEVIDFIKNCPSDILQLIDSLDYLEYYLRNGWSFGFDLQVINIDSFKIVEPLINSSVQIQLFFLDGSSEKHVELFERIKSNKSVIRFYYFYKSNHKRIDERGLVYSSDDFIKTLIENEVEILKYLQLKDAVINPSIAIAHKDLIEFHYFSPTRTNFFLINSIIGNFGYEEDSLTNEQKEAKHIEKSTKALKNQNSFERQELFLNQIRKIDFFFNAAYQEKILLPAGFHSSILPPIILVIPFHNPDLKDIYGNKDLTDLLQVEQTENYLNVTVAKQDFKLTTAGMSIQQDRLKYLDDVSFLHSSFSFSPTVRLPIRGKSIYRELSFFRTSTFPNVSLAKNRRKLKKTIYNFGKIFKEKTISPELGKLLKRRNGQIVVISDLPIEWTMIDGIPLSFTHDICRLPETTLHGLMSFFTNNQFFEYSIPSNILQKTLVIFGTDEPDFEKWHENIQRLSKRDGFVAVKCKKLEEVKKIIQEIKPDLLIFDCHGGYDKESRSTFLQIGDEILDSKFVVEENISAPLIFLSACGTAPTYGTMNPIANAFFEAGAISVTSTYLPISIDTGSILYLRILNNLKYAATHGIHKNWLEFICHVIRTSSIHEAYRLARTTQKNVKSDDFMISNIDALNDSLEFSKRRKLFESMDKKISSLTNDDKLYYSEIIPEYLLYTNLGRGDLILFDKWKEEFLNKNVR